MLLHYVGGKTRLLSEIEARMPLGSETLIDVFCGGGAVTTHFSKTHTVIANDLSTSVITLYKTLQDNNPEMTLDYYLRSLEASVATYNNCKDEEERKQLYLKGREKFNILLEKGATNPVLFTVINRSCFNGLMRFNKKGLFNAPFGAKKKLGDLPAQAIEFAESIEGVEFFNLDYEAFLYEVLKTVDKANTVIYLDPPYISSTPSGSEIKYSADGFDCERYIKILRELDADGWKFMASNSYCEATLELFKDFQIDTVELHSTLAGSNKARKVIKEIIVKNY